MSDDSNGSSSGIVAIFAIIVLVGMVIAFFMYGLPRMQPKMPENGTIKVEMPNLPTPSPIPAPEAAAPKTP